MSGSVSGAPDAPEALRPRLCYVCGRPLPLFSTDARIGVHRDCVARVKGRVVPRQPGYRFSQEGRNAPK